MNQIDSKADTLTKIVLVFFISLLSFTFGTYVGKAVSDHDHEVMRQQVMKEIHESGQE